MQRASDERGFTLLEILVALVVLGFLMAGLTQGVRFGLRAWDTETKLVNSRADLDGVERVVRSVLQEADPGEFNEPSIFKGEPRLVTFYGRMPTTVRGLPVREADLSIGVDAKHRMVLRWLPHPHAERLGPPILPVENVLLENVDHLEFSYRRWPNQGGGWVDKWELPTLPVMISLKIVFPKDDRRHWPTMVLAPMRSHSDE